ncbi:MAG: GlsB/YeaQ/YmgE family stress response membrane protein [Desulfomonilia bacterium]|uniref:Putative inner membrane protein with transglycosylase-associated domain n=1 Tax=anaerobic digester metagenome TaxID=1263854 RepID=A0A485M5C0_9ZZZZ|nr:GlsB/YeaQ/YmgE family stress response membrane protein [Pseudomonadota bacterium]HON39114.1 GlsB/YeaQ/YmgE family stress response membrane protein [Deltaproteobacteria bacterium]HRS56132.1 GlsB/YeaQ/YmgE family stress response membrane protein [Desulfomonilia bacterium]HPD21191.1 GlsB/YeaQ/YmgE family stress response membrane protein [Deltaproteobacteria bacterium]HPX18158.1 GlsB/YeaQ/YmgE family stress response membrane protein [Deltaproteobacteria bacterium]
MGILSWIIVGIIAGWLTGLIMKGGGYGIFGDMILGIVGALVGGFLAGALFGVQAPLTGLNIGTLVIAVLGAILVVAIVRALPGRTRV